MPHMLLEKHRLEVKGSICCFDTGRQMMSDDDKVAKYLWEIGATFSNISWQIRGGEGG